MTEPAQIILRVPQAVKAAWVLRSRAAGMRLTDWVVEMTELGEKVSAIEFAKEVEARIFSFVSIEHDKKSDKWSVGLFLPMSSQFDASLPAGAAAYPPGQLIDMHEPSALLSEDDEAGYDRWAGAPWFNSHESAAAKIIEWIKENRRDIVKACEDETRQAIAYRRARALKSKAD